MANHFKSCWNRRQRVNCASGHALTGRVSQDFTNYSHQAHYDWCCLKLLDLNTGNFKSCLPMQRASMTQLFRTTPQTQRTSNFKLRKPSRTLTPPCATPVRQAVRCGHRQLSTSHRKREFFAECTSIFGVFVHTLTFFLCPLLVFFFPFLHFFSFVCRSPRYVQSQDPHRECTGCCREDGRKFLPQPRGTTLSYKNLRKGAQR